MNARNALLMMLRGHMLNCGVLLAWMLMAHLGIQAQTTLRSSAPIYTDGVYVVLNGANLRLDSGAELPGDGTWRFEGSMQQSLTNNAGSNAAFPNLELDNADGLLLVGDPLYIDGNVVFVEGIIDAATNGLRVDFGSTASHTGAGPDGYVEGAVWKAGDAAFTFPVGENGIYAPARRLATPSGTYEVRYRGSSSPNAGPYYDGNSFPVSTCEYWEFDRISGTANPRMYFSYAYNSCNDVGDFNFLDLVWWNSINWDPVIGVDHNAAEIGSIAPLDPSWTGQYTLSSFNANLNVLPISLLAFDAQPTSEATVLLTWSTASEINNDYFSLERSKDTGQWEAIAEIKGAGNSNNTLHYSHVDKNPLMGLSYYRLKQTDYDGTYSYSEVKSVMVDQEPHGFELKPPYRVGDDLQVPFTLAEGVAYFEVFDLLGKRMSPKVQTQSNEGNVRLALSMARGVYVLRASSQAGEVASRPFFW